MINLHMFEMFENNRQESLEFRVMSRSESVEIFEINVSNPLFFTIFHSIN